MVVDYTKCNVLKSAKSNSEQSSGQGRVESKSGSYVKYVMDVVIPNGRSGTPAHNNETA